MAETDICVVILTTGSRDLALDRLLESVRIRRDEGVGALVIGNGAEISRSTTLDAAAGSEPSTARWATTKSLDTNLGIPAARNLALQVDAQVLLFLDDDAELITTDVFAPIRELFDSHHDLAAVALRLVDEEGATVRRHVPRLGRSGTEESGWVAAFPGGAVAIRREAMEAVGGYPDEFFYGMEETDLAVRLIDAGWKIWYAADLLVFHPRTEPSRHPDAYWRLARNRVWLAHRNFPVPVAVVYLALRALLTIARQPSLAKSQLSGYRDGWRTRIGPRRPISWRTVWRLTRLGRPPII